MLKPVATAPDFALDVKAVRAACGHKTRAVLINSPNNPTGRVYPAETLASLAEVLAEQSRWHGRGIYLIADEPYRRIVYDGVKVPSAFTVYASTMVVCSYSKELSLAGERIGFLIVNPRAARSRS